MPKAKINDITFYYEVRGEGFPVLLIAGLGSDNSSWLGVRRELSKNFRVITFDNRGCGRSGVPCKPYSVRDMAGDAVGLLDHLNIRKCHVVGHSMGGYIAQEMAISYPAYISKLILEASAAVSSERNNRLFNDFLKQIESGNGLECLFSQWTYWLFSPKTFKSKTFIPTFLKNIARYPYKQSAEGFKGQIGAIASFDAAGRIRRIKVKTLVVVGSDDMLILQAESKVLAEKIPDSSLITIKDTGHCIHLENLNGFIKAVTDFLKSGPLT